jgi:hypothetical protein
MRRISFIITILGIFTLLLILVLQSPINITAQEQLKSLEQNQKIILKGQVTAQKLTKTTKTLTINNISIICDKPCPQNYLNKNLTILGTLNKYKDKTQIMALKINQFS